MIRTSLWSVPVVAAAVAAPAFAASEGALPVCSSCNGSAPPACFLVGGTGAQGTCRCGSGLACVGTGPLGLVNVCVGQDLLPLAVSCGGATCVGTCLDAGGTAVTAINTLVTGTTTLVNGVAGCTASNTGTLPSNVCVTPVARDGVGRLGAICLVSSGGGLLGTALATLVNTLKTTLNGLGLGPAATCDTGLTCRGGVNVSATGALCAAAGFNQRVGFCQC